MFKEKYRAIYDQIKPGERLLSDTLALGQDNNKRKPKWALRFIAVPAGAIASLFIAFTLLVNLSFAFAQTVEGVPILGGLSAFVSFQLNDTVSYSPSLTKAVENEYLQVIGEEQTIGDITLRIEYVIVDQRQLHVFWSLHSDRYSNLFPTSIALLDAEGQPLGGYMVLGSRSMIGLLTGEVAQDGLRHYIFNFVDTEVPDRLIFESGVFDSSPEMAFEPNESQTTAFTNIYKAVPISTFSIPLTIDTGMVLQSETIAVNQEIAIDGQILSIDSIEILPTHTRVNITEHEQNTARLMDISCYLVDENGDRLDPTGYSSDIWRYGDITTTFHLESAFFIESQHLTLVITDVVWLSKNVLQTRVDLAAGVADNLPPGVELMSVERIENDWALAFSAPNREQKFHDPFYDDMARWAYKLFSDEFHYEAGLERSFITSWISNDSYERWRFFTREEIDAEMQWGFNDGWVYGVSGAWEPVETPGAFGWTLILKDYPFEVLYLTPAFSQLSAPVSPIEITVR